MERGAGPLLRDGAARHALVGDRPDGLTLIGDGWQTIYPGGDTLSEVRISLAGRVVVLDVNHRNAAGILDFAKQMVADDRYVDIERWTVRAMRSPR